MKTPTGPVYGVGEGVGASVLASASKDEVSLISDTKYPSFPVAGRDTVDLNSTQDLTCVHRTWLGRNGPPVDPREDAKPPSSN